MNINGQITILFNESGLDLEITDKDANTTFAVIKLDREQTCKALSRIGYTSCDIRVCNLDRVGMIHENKKLDFRVGHIETWKVGTKLLYQKANESCPEGWTVDNYFGSQDSTFHKGDELWGRCTIRRWTKKDE